MIGCLSRLFRYALGSNENRAPLIRGVKIVGESCSLYRARFGDRLRLCWHIGPEVDLPETQIMSAIALDKIAEIDEDSLSCGRGGGGNEEKSCEITL